jgi:PKD repeat protein
VTLTVTDDLGGTDDDFTYAVIGGAGNPPVADAGGPYNGAVDAQVNFDAGDSTAGDADITTYAWSFGDDRTGSGETLSHVYTGNGVYDVTLVVQDSNGLIDGVQTTATIGTGNVPPTAKINGPYSAEPDVEISLDGSGSSDPEGEIASYIWDYGDGKSGSGETTTHTYIDEGEYIATLTVTDAANATDSATSGVTISLLPPPPVDEEPPPPPPNDDSGSCFIATAAYGSYLGPELRLLRNFRDQQLLTNAPGQAFVRWYYRTSPPFADAIAEHGSLRLMARVALTPLVYSIKYPLAAGLLFLLMIVAALGWRMRPPSKAAMEPAIS